MAGTIVADTIQADSTSTLVLKNGVANTPPTIQDSAGTQIGTFCRAFCSFDGTTNTGGFCTIKASFNVTSVADNGTGDYTVNYTNSFSDANYSIVATSGGGSKNNTIQVIEVITKTTTNTNIYQSTQTSALDSSDLNVAVFR